MANKETLTNKKTVGGKETVANEETVANKTNKATSSELSDKELEEIAGGKKKQFRK